MAGQTLDLENIVTTEQLAAGISNKYIEWEMFRKEWMEQKKELRNYIFATDTTTTTNSQLDWKNTTTTPKLCQIRDNLHANYMAALMPNSNWLEWIGNNAEAETLVKKQATKEYMKQKLRVGKARKTISQYLLDYIDYGMVFGTTEYVSKQTEDEQTGETISGFVGPRLVRISPLDIVFNPLAPSFDESPKIIRSLNSIGGLRKILAEKSDSGYLEVAINKLETDRARVATSVTSGDSIKSDGFKMDGFSNYEQYFDSGYVEILDFYGDFYDMETETLLQNYVISIADRSTVIRKIPNPSWLGTSPIRSVGWRQRPDNLYSMGPLDNLVGMQYRIDHLENLKADVFDFIAAPVLKITGNVDDFVWAPFERIVVADDGNVEMMHPDVTALNADTQIALLENKMEEMAGAPREAMGMRTPGEKTAFEMQVLQNGSGRIFQNKAGYFEENFIEDLMNDMLEQARRNILDKELIRVFDDETQVADFLSITKEDISADGRLVPIGARHFAEQAQAVQNLNNFMNSAVGQDPSVNVHISGFALAKSMERLLGLENENLVQQNIRVEENAETARISQAVQEQIAVEAATPSGTGSDF